MESEPWEKLDVDDSDLPSFLRPCKRFHSDSNSSQSQTLIDADSAPPLIPGPAGAVQAAMRHRRSRDPLEEPLLSTQEFIQRVIQNSHESDHDFTTNAWLSALHFLRSLHRDSDSVKPLNSLKKLVKVNVARIPLVVAFIKSCTANAFGDMMVTLKDPTGSISASVHHEVFSNGEFKKDITVGSVLVLQKVAVFAPTRSSCYLNITLHNILKVFCKDCTLPSGQIQSSVLARQTTPDIERHQETRMMGNTSPLPQERTQGIMTNLSLDSNFVEGVDIHKQMGEDLVVPSHHSDDGNDRNQKTVFDRENLSFRQDQGLPENITSGDELQTELNGQHNPPKSVKGDTLNLACSARGGGSLTRSSVHMSVGLETEVMVSNSQSTIPNWTDEQLDELLTFD
ncbi:hypothetical protein PIB30_060114 [Stylosanthes scabra]|uniref:Homologous recombination OB-fold protein OB-fold domain-containing protein n=1 Tax=Stylosanthes scabra TaxID=79078 RepID=A0ABU6VK87_9FABA|nr:hypothetical protein [Stylosanthes scabra]